MSRVPVVINIVTEGPALANRRARAFLPLCSFHRNTTLLITLLNKRGWRKELYSVLQRTLSTIGLGALGTVRPGQIAYTREPI